MDITLERILSLIPRTPDGKHVHDARKQFAQSIGLESGNLIADWEKGRNKSYHKYIYEIAAKYNVSVEWLKGESEMKKTSIVMMNKSSTLFADLEYMSKDEILDLISRAVEILRDR